MSGTRHITLPGGFRAAGVACGIKPSGKRDMALLAADRDCSMAVVTTSNQVIGAPVQYIRNTWPRGYGKARAIVVNSGNSNVCTGKAGLRDAERMAGRVAKHLDTDAGKVLVASTGVIGHRLPMPRIRDGIDKAAGALQRRDDASIAEAILTTDLRPKSAVVQIRIGGKSVTVAGIVKGSGMIAPSMATMIALLTTDAACSPALLHRALKQAVATTFHAITVDSDTSTSDTVAVLASGTAGGRAIQAGSRDFQRFCSALEEVCGELARAVVADGEGATKLVEILVRGAKSSADAEAAAKSVANSPLVKTAVHGGDPNWGRIAMAVGKSAAKVDPGKLKIRVGPGSEAGQPAPAGELLFSRGTGRAFDVKKVEKALQENVVRIDCDLGLGKGNFTALTCDLSREYIAINADYTT